MFKISDNTLYLFFAIMALTEIFSQFLLKKGSIHKDYLNMYFFLGLIAIFITYVFLYFVDNFIIILLKYRFWTVSGDIHVGHCYCVVEIEGNCFHF